MQVMGKPGDGIQKVRDISLSVNVMGGHVPSLTLPSFCPAPHTNLISVYHQADPIVWKTSLKRRHWRIFSHATTCTILLSCHFGMCTWIVTWNRWDVTLVWFKAFITTSLYELTLQHPRLILVRTLLEELLSRRQIVTLGITLKSSQTDPEPNETEGKWKPAQEIAKQSSHECEKWIKEIIKTDNRGTSCTFPSFLVDVTGGTGW